MRLGRNREKLQVTIYFFSSIVRNMDFGGTISSNNFSIPLLECTQDIKKPRAESLSKIYSINHHLESHSSKTYFIYLCTLHNISISQCIV